MELVKKRRLRTPVSRSVSEASSSSGLALASSPSRRACFTMPTKAKTTTAASDSTTRNFQTEFGRLRSRNDHAASRGRIKVTGAARREAHRQYRSVYGSPYSDTGSRRCTKSSGNVMPARQADVVESYQLPLK